MSTSGSDLTGEGTELSPFRTIQYALDQSAEGASVFCCAPGVYTENIIWQSGGAVSMQSLMGSGITTISGTSSSLDIITVSANNVSLGGFTIDSGRYGLNLSSNVLNITISDISIQETDNHHVLVTPEALNNVMVGVTLVPHASGTRRTQSRLGGELCQSLLSGQYHRVGLFTIWEMVNSLSIGDRAVQY